ncbi:MAG: hypothetical protein ACLRZN_05960 [Dialister invisus]
MESMGGSFVEYYSDRRMHVFLLQTFANMNEFSFARMAAENRILLPVLGMFLLSIAAPAWKNIQKPGPVMNKADLRRKKKPGKGGYTCSWICTGVSSGTVSRLRKGNQSYVSGSISDCFPGVRYICQRAGAFFTLALEGPAEESAGGAA